MSISNILLEITVYSALIFCFIMLFKKMFGKHISPALHYCIWLLLVVRLMMPVTIDSGFRLFTIPAENTPVSENVQLPTDDEINPDINTTDEGALVANENSGVADFSRQEDGFRQPRVATMKTIKWSTILLYVWITGAALSILYLVWSYLYLKKRIRQSAASPDKELSDIFHRCIRELGIKRNIRMILQGEINSPALLIFPVLLIPADIMQTMDKQQIAFAIKHELMHYKRKDHIACLLLSLLQAVYWFNPFVWLAYRQIRLDMETACDSMVVKSMDSDERLKYATTILSLFSRKKQLPVMLSMAVVNTKKTAKKRIKGIYMRGTSSRKGRLAAALLACIMVLTCFTTACQPTPEKEIVIGKGDDNELEEIISGTPAPTLASVDGEKNIPISNMIITEEWNEQIAGNNVEVNIAADVLVPDVQAYPIMEVVPLIIDSGLAKKFIEVFASEAEYIFNGCFIETKKQNEQAIVEVRKTISDLEAGIIPPDDKRPVDEQIAEQEAILERAMQGYLEFETAEDMKETPVNWEFTKKVESADVESIDITALFNNDKEIWFNFAINKQTNIEFSDVNILNTAYKGEVTIERSVASSEAKDIASKAIQELGIGEFDLAYEEILDNGIELTFTKRYRGIPITSVKASGGSSGGVITEEEAKKYSAPISQETIIISVNDGAINSFSWGCPLSEIKTENENVKLLSLDEIKEIFREQIFYNIVSSDGDEKQIDIQDIRLGYMTIPIKDDINRFRLIPVWDFIGPSCTDQKVIDEMAELGIDITCPVSYLAINAFDGSIIDRGLGY